MICFVSHVLGALLRFVLAGCASPIRRLIGFTLFFARLIDFTDDPAGTTGRQTSSHNGPVQTNRANGPAPTKERFDLFFISFLNAIFRGQLFTNIYLFFRCFRSPLSPATQTQLLLCRWVRFFMLGFMDDFLLSERNVRKLIY